MNRESNNLSDDEKRRRTGNKRLIGCVVFLVLGCVFLVVGWQVYGQTKPCRFLDILFKISGCEARTKIFPSSMFRLSQDGGEIVSLVEDRKKELDILDLKTDVLKQVRSEDGMFGGNGDADLMEDIALSADGQYAAVVSGGYVGLVDAHAVQPQVLWLDLSEKEYATRAAVSPDGKTFAAAIKSGQDYIALYNIPDGKKIGELRTERQNQAVAYSSNGQVVTAFGGSIQFWDVNTQTVAREFGSNLKVYTLLFSPDGSLLVATTGKNYSFGAMTVDVFRVADGQLLHHLTFDKNENFYADVKITFSVDNQILAAASCDQVSMFQLSDGALYRKFTPFSEGSGFTLDCLSNIQFTPDGKSMYYGRPASMINKIQMP